MRARGLKLKSGEYDIDLTRVAPRAGAWIETYAIIKIDFCLESRPVRARGLKLIALSKKLDHLSRAPCGRVD